MKVTSEHQAQAIQPLVITPSPFRGESLPGFILRTAERNGYESPMKLLHYAGMDDNEARSARPSLEKLAPLYISPLPDTRIRVFLDMEGLSSHVQLPAQRLSSVERQGFTVVEWGGLARDGSVPALR